MWRRKKIRLSIMCTNYLTTYPINYWSVQFDSLSNFKMISVTWTPQFKLQSLILSSMHLASKRERTVRRDHQICKRWSDSLYFCNFVSHNNIVDDGKNCFPLILSKLYGLMIQVSKCKVFIWFNVWNMWVGTLVNIIIVAVLLSLDRHVVVHYDID